MSATLQFDSERHIYSLGGVRLPSVTQILEGVGIINYDHIPTETREQALLRGKSVHLLTHFDDEGDLDEASVEPHLAGYLAGWRKFRLETEVGRMPITAMEHQMFHVEHWYAGTLDREFGGKVIVDIKTGEAPWWVRIQLAAYRELRKNTEAIHRLAVELHKDGTYRLRPLKLSERRNDLDAFNAALRVYRELQEKAWR